MLKRNHIPMADVLNRYLLCIIMCIAGWHTAAANRYVDHSVLAQGRWVKIKVAETGFHQLTDAMLVKAGFSDPQRVKVYGYGGALQPEKLTGDYLQTTDDLKEVTVCRLQGRTVFYAVGPVNWPLASYSYRDRNPYSDYGYYFLTENSDEPLLQDSATFVSSNYPMPNDYHSLYEVDNYSWYHGGRNLYERDVLGVGVDHDYTLTAQERTGKVTVSMSYKDYCNATVLVNDTMVGSILVDEKTIKSPQNRAYPDKYSKAAQDVWSFTLTNVKTGDNKITIRQESGAEMRLDYIVLSSTHPKPLAVMASEALPEPEIVGEIKNQDLHAHQPVDMVIIVPTSRKFIQEAERLKVLHETYDALSVRIVAADELYNEFSSGTPDANAYKRYLKMLYDRSEGASPRFLLLFGDAAWDNRMRAQEWQSTALDDFLLCYESDNSYSETECYVTDDYFCMLDDDEGDDLLKTNKGDVAVGRLPARTPEEAKILVDKIYSYRLNEHPGAWQNIICMMGDDGNANLHMQDAEEVCKVLDANYTAFNIKKFYWDAYTRVTTSVGESYPDVANLIKQQMKDGALIMNYSGHGGPTGLSHEQVVMRPDFAESTSLRLPLWVTASCDIMPFDGQEENIGETAMFNPNGGAVAFFGTTRTVYAQHNRPMNKNFMKYVLGTTDNGRRITIGEAVRMAKNDLITGSSNRQANINKLHYTLLGDPALVLAAPTLTAVIDSINGVPVNSGIQKLVAGASVRVSGHVPGYENFDGTATLTVRDVEETIVGRMNPLDASEMPKAPIQFKDRPNTIYQGSDSVRNGRFTFVFAIPKDITYSDEVGQLLVYAVNSDHTLTAHGQDFSFVMGSADSYPETGEGPDVTCYLDHRSFAAGDTVGVTPYFYAELYDEDGINASGSGIGHDLELIIDGEVSRTYNLNTSFVYDFGDYRRGALGFSIPALSYGSHHLLFRAWDVLNHSATVELDFFVDPNYDPNGIRDVMNEERFAMRRRNMQGAVYDASGRYVGEQIPHRPGIYIFRSQTGIVKKIMVKGNN